MGGSRLFVKHFVAAQQKIRQFAKAGARLMAARLVEKGKVSVYSKLNCWCKYPGALRKTQDSAILTQLFVLNITGRRMIRFSIVIGILSVGNRLEP